MDIQKNIQNIYERKTNQIKNMANTKENCSYNQTIIGSTDEIIPNSSKKQAECSVTSITTAKTSTDKKT